MSTPSDLPSILDAVFDLERQVTSLPPGDPRLAEIGARIDAVEDQVQRQLGMGQPLVPDASSPPSRRDVTAESLDRALKSLRSAVASKR